MRKEVITYTISTGVLPAIKLKQEEDVLPWVDAMYEGGARIVEVTMTTPGALASLEAIAHKFGNLLYAAAGTVLDAATARSAILAGAGCIVSPATVTEVIETAHRYGAACYIGAFTATECLSALQAGADMVKIFPAALGGPQYMTNLKMVYPEIELIPSGGVSLENAADFIRSGASAISGSRNFFDREMVLRQGPKWITARMTQYIALVAEAKANRKPMP